MATPVNWKPGEDVIIAGSVSDEDAKKSIRTAGARRGRTCGACRNPRHSADHRPAINDTTISNTEQDHDLDQSPAAESRVLISLMFLLTAVFKLTNFFLAVSFFTSWGIPMWLMHFIGASELAGVIGLLIPRTRLAAAFGLFLMMIGGLVTHLTHGEYFLATMPILYGGGLYLLVKESLPELLSVHQPVRATV